MKGKGLKSELAYQILDFVNHNFDGKRCADGIRSLKDLEFRTKLQPALSPEKSAFSEGISEHLRVELSIPMNNCRTDQGYSHSTFGYKSIDELEAAVKHYLIEMGLKRANNPHSN